MRACVPIAAAVVVLALISSGRISTESAGAQPVTTCSESSARPPSFAMAGLTVNTPKPLYDGVEATVTPLSAASGLAECEEIGGLVAIGTSSANLLFVQLYAHSRLPGKFVTKYQWATRGQWHVAPAFARGIPWSARTSHVLRLRRVRPSFHWLVEVDGQIMNRIKLPGTQRGLAVPRALLFADNHDDHLNRGSFRFDGVRLRSVTSDRWSEFPRGKTWLYTEHRSYVYVKLPRRTSFIVKSR
jgi:hypothetical protein